MAPTSNDAQYCSDDYAIGGVAVLISIDHTGGYPDPERLGAWCRGAWLYRVHTGGHPDRVLADDTLTLGGGHTHAEVAELVDRLTEDAYNKGKLNCDDCGNPWMPCHCP